MSKLAKQTGVRMITALVITGFLLTMSVQSPLAANAVRSTRIALGGVTGLGNNVAFAFNRYVLVAPYAPNITVTDATTLGELDNHFLYILDTKKSNGAPAAIDLQWFDPNDSEFNRLYYPTKLYFEPIGSNVFIRGTRFVHTDAGYQPVEAIAYLHLNLDDNGKPVADKFAVPIDIRGIDNEPSDAAPIDFALGRDGKYLVFTNGASIFTYSVTEGYVYGVEIVHPSEYKLDANSISYLDVDSESNTITVCWNKSSTSEDGATTTASELSFYSLGSDGTIDLIKRAFAGSLPGDSYLTAGSNVAIKVNQDKLTPDVAWFLSSAGTLCEIDLKGNDVSADVRGVQTFPELADTQGPQLIQYDKVQRTIVIVSQGYSVQIGRPSNGRRTGIGRPSNGHRILSAPAVALLKLTKKGKTVDSAVINAPFADSQGLSNAVLSDSGLWFIADYTGSLFSLDLSSDLGDTKVEKIGDVGTRVERIDFFGSRDTVIAVNSFESDDSGFVSSPGFVVFGRLFDPSAQFRKLQSRTAAASSYVPAHSIRRPSNDRK